MRTPLIREAHRSRANLYFVHGTADEQNSILGFDVLRAELEAAGKAAVYDGVSGANHAMDLPGETSPAGLRTVFARVVDWFLPANAGSPRRHPREGTGLRSPQHFPIER